LVTPKPSTNVWGRTARRQPSIGAKLRKPEKLSSPFAEIYDDSNPKSREDRGSGRATPLSQASRQVRINALELIPTLIERLGEAVDGAVKTIEEAKKLIR
jgi:hypothetical protein